MAGQFLIGQAAVEHQVDALQLNILVVHGVAHVEQKPAGGALFIGAVGCRDERGDQSACSRHIGSFRFLDRLDRLVSGDEFLRILGLALFFLFALLLGEGGAFQCGRAERSASGEDERHCQRRRRARSLV